jgi:hypothetical protein
MLSHWIPEQPTIEITTHAHLEDRPDVAFPIATAPDGLAIALHVSRSVDVRGPVLAAVRSPEAVPPVLERPLADLERAAHALSLHTGIVKAGGRQFYETGHTMYSLLGRTLLARMLGSDSPMVMAGDGHVSDPNSARIVHTAVHSMRDQAGQAMESLPDVTSGRDARMWIATRDGSVYAVPKSGDFAGARPVVFESLLALRSARWHVTERKHFDRVATGKLAEHRAYVNALRIGGSVAWTVSRADVAQVVAELARAVDRDFHARRRVHGDLKPDNVLLTDTGISAFDAVDVAEGETCAAVSEGWASPEQIFVRPASAATDVFALAQLAASALSACVYGTESTVIVPAAGQGRRRLRVISDPEVWLDPAIVDLPTPARLAWRDLLMRCLAANPERRPQRASELAGALDQLLAKWDVPGTLPVACGPGVLRLPINGDVPTWVISDRR